MAKAPTTPKNCSRSSKDLGMESSFAISFNDVASILFTSHLYFFP
jgi:hypothetical protein